ALVLWVIVATGIEDERNALELLVLLPLATEREPVHARQHDVGDDRIGRLTARNVERSQAVRCLLDLMTAASQQLLDRALFRFPLKCDQDDTHALLPPSLSRSYLRAG